jgi:hypothetical protein
VPKLPRNQLIVVRCLIEQLSQLPRFFFTDGQANVDLMTKHYNDLIHLNKIDWKIIHDSDFRNDAHDTDKQRRYQAEFLVQHHVPANYIESINVVDEKAATFVKAALSKTALFLKINVIPEYFFVTQ